MSELASGPESAQQPKGQDILSRVGNAAPPWANGLAVILAALVAVLSVLNVDFGELLSSKISNDAAQVRTEIESTATIIGSLNASIQAQAGQIAQLSADNVDLRAQILTLKYQVQSLQASCLPLTPEVFALPTPTQAPTPGLSPDGGGDRQWAP